jgi:hypothetical protein
MRKIEKLMLDAIRDRKDFKLDNTQVICTQFTHGDRKIDRVNVLLHGSTIAIITPQEVDVSDCGWQTPTTKSRLHVILSELCDAGVYQKNHKWFCYSKNADTEWFIPIGSRQVLPRCG